MTFTHPLRVGAYDRFVSAQTACAGTAAGSLATQPLWPLRW